MALIDVLKTSFEFSPKLGVREQPELTRLRESNVRGIYIVGDLADAPVIKAAVNQGYETAQLVCTDLEGSPDEADLLDVVVVGAGPAGIGSALALSERGAKYVVLERERPLATIQNFPKAKLIFSEPRHIPTPSGLWFADAVKEDLIDRWEQAIDEHSLNIRQPEAVVDVQRRGDHFLVHSEVLASKNVYRAKRVILAIGRRAAVRKLDIDGEELDKVDYALRDPRDYAGKQLLVVGGGDSALEAALSCSAVGATVTISYRGDVFSRAKAENRRDIEAFIAEGRIRCEYGSKPIQVLEDRVVLERGGERLEIPNEAVLIFIGNTLPTGFMSKLGLRMQGAMDAWRIAWIMSFALVTYLFYVLKSGVDCVGGTANAAVCEGGMWVAKKAFFPFGPDHVLGFVPGFLKMDLGFRTVDGGFWGTVIYSAVIVGFGLAAYRKYPSAEQKRRYIWLMVFQALFLFGIPELLAPLVIDRPWKWYALVVPWPLSIWSLVDAPSWAGGSFWSAAGWLGVGAFSTFVAIPLYVRYQGERFCSYLCGCGGLAETLGDRWRHLAPRGKTAVQGEWFGVLILAAAIPVTLLILNDAWGFFAAGALHDTKAFAEHWYGLMVDFWLASVVGVAFYPYLGNRLWCRYFCPLRAYMEVLSRWFSKVQIESNDKCIGCGECTRYCQMGIDVQRFAQLQDDMHNANSACIQCGICVEVCPMDVLELTQNR